MIGIFDSGVGGLSILREVDKLLPAADIAYLADTSAFPYGMRSREFLIDRTEKVVYLLTERGARLIVAACNTATVVAISHLRKVFDIPFVGVEPPVKTAARAAAAEEPIYVLLTENTASGEKYANLVKKFGPGRRVMAVSLPMLARVVEDGSFREPGVAAEVVRLMKERVGTSDEGCVNVVLGCTHYVFLEDLITESLGPLVKIFDPGAAVARQVARILDQKGKGLQGSGKRVFLCTGDVGRFSESLERLLGWEGAEVEGVGV